MRPEMQSIRNEISTHYKRNYVYITFHCGAKWNEISFRGWFDKKTAHPVKVNSSCFDEINVCVDVSFRMISFRVVFTWHFITRNEISKWPQLNNNRKEFHFGLYHVNSYKKLTWHRNKNISFCPKLNFM